MNVRSWVLLLALIGSGIGAFGLARVKAVRRAGQVSAIAVEPETHKVTPEMLATANGRAKTAAPPFRRSDAQGVIQDLADLLKTGPIVLVFIKDGCPCSASAAPYFNALHDRYGGRLHLIGVIDGDAALARRWGSANGVLFPIMPDTGLEIAKSYGATNSAFVALVDPQGQVDELWPGYSATMLEDLNRRAAAMAGLTKETIETADAPEELYSGCPFPWTPNSP
jgi:peroxiredoxin